MENINERIALLRKTLGLSMRGFAESLGITASSVNKLEKGENNPSERTILLLCSEFGVSEEWLRRGDGDMFVTLSRDEEITRYLGDLLKDDGEDKEFQRRFVRTLSKLSESDWQMIQRFAEELAKKD